MLEKWLDETLPNGEGPLVQGLNQTRMKRKDLAKAIKFSNNSMPGPDGIPYSCWRVLGSTGEEILWAALNGLQAEDGKELLNAA